mmetsp:Transcript_33404/g.34037  ORF Transcript_33404/g.34037 Transcript_33404/m.34037 type:complete len:255 (-) Transcript_33404:37-801(-)
MFSETALICMTFILMIPVSSPLGFGFFSSYVSRGATVPREPVTKYAEYGSLPQLENTFKAVECASPIVAVRSENCTVLSFLEQDDTLLIKSIGAQPISSLVNPWQHLFLTGSAGDCRMVTRYAQNRVLNYTVSFNAAPSGLYIANEIGKYLQQATQGMTRPLACHAFVIDAIGGTLFEIDASGQVSEVIAGVSGKGMKNGINILENSLISSMQLEELKSLSKLVLTKMNEESDKEVKRTINQIIVSDRGWNIKL